MHKFLSETIPNSISLYPEEQSPEDMFPITYLQKYYKMTLRRQMEGVDGYQLNAPKRLSIAQAIMRVFISLHGIHHVHNDFNRDNIFIEETKTASGEPAYVACLNDFDLTEDLTDPIMLEIQWPQNSSVEERMITQCLLRTPIFDTLSVLYEIYRLVLGFIYPVAGAPDAFKVLSSNRLDIHKCFYESFKVIKKNVENQMIPDNELALRAASNRMAIGNLFYQTALAAQDFRERVRQDATLAQELKIMPRSREQVEALLAKLHEDFPTMKQLYDQVTWLMTAKYIKKSSTWLRYAEMENVNLP